MFNSTQIKKAWKVRREAAKKWECGVMEISWKECFKMTGLELLMKKIADCKLTSIGSDKDYQYNLYVKIKYDSSIITEKDFLYFENKYGNFAENFINLIEKSERKANRKMLTFDDYEAVEEYSKNHDLGKPWYDCDTRKINVYQY